MMFIKELYEKDIGLSETQGVDIPNIPTRVAVRGLIKNNEGKIAWIRIPHYWGANLPGGGVDGQSLEDALRREIREEVGADITNIVPLGITREYRYGMDTPIISNNVVFSADVIGNLNIPTPTKEEILNGDILNWSTPEEALQEIKKLLLDDISYGATFVLHREIYILEQYIAQNANQSVQNTKELEEIAKKAQYDYIMLKSEFDSYIRRMESDSKEGKINQLVDLAKKLLPIIDQLGQSVSHIPADLEGNTWAAGVKLTYENAGKTLSGLGISQIPTIGHEPDMELHDPLSVQPTDDESQKGKIISEFQPGYVYEKDGVKKVITAAKVIVGQ